MSDVSIFEGDHGTRTAVFVVALSKPNASNAVNVNYSTADVDATGVATSGVAGGDYVSQLNRSLTFASGQFVKYVAVTVIGDTNNCGTEADGETFHLVLSGATNALITRSTGVGTILNDDSECGIGVRIGDATVVEGDSNRRDARLTVTLSDAAPSTFSITVATGRAGDTATGVPSPQAGGDYLTTNRTISVPPASRSVIIGIPILGDTVGEAREFFSVSITSTLGHVARPIGNVTIIDDDRLTAPLVTTYTDPAIAPGGGVLTTGPDGAVWFTSQYGNIVGRITMAGKMTIFREEDGVAPEPYAITTGSDGNLWYSTFNAHHTIGHITPSGKGLPPVTDARISSVWATSGPDGAIWFNNQFTPDRIARLDISTNQLTFFDEPGGNHCTDHQIISGPDGALWNTCQGNGVIERITTSGQITPYDSGGLWPWGITVGPDGALWYTLLYTGAIGRMDPKTGVFKLFHDSRLKYPSGITTGPDGALWFANNGGNSIGRMTIGGDFTYITDPSMDQPSELTAGPDGAIWFNNNGNGLIGRITLP